MDEQQIQEQLAEKVKDPDVSPDTETAPELPTAPRPEPKENEEFIHDNLPLEATLDKMKLLDYFEIPQTMRRESDIDKWMGRVMDWAKDEARSSDYTDILRVINDQERVMGNKLKPDRLMRLAQFVTINQQRKRLIEQERALYNA